MKKSALTALLALFPVVASAQSLQPVGNLISAVSNLLGMVVPILITLALIVFFWGLVKYIWKSGKSHDEGKRIMVAGLVSLFVMVSIWGIILMAQVALNVNPNAPVQSPGVPTAGPGGGQGWCTGSNCQGYY